MGSSRKVQSILGSNQDLVHFLQIRSPPWLTWPSAHRSRLRSPHLLVATVVLAVAAAAETAPTVAVAVAAAAAAAWRVSESEPSERR